MGNKPNSTRQQQTAIAASYKGPLPPASQLSSYEDIVPGSADRIICTYEKQVSHRHSIESQYVKSACRNSTLGLILGATISLFALAMSGYLIYSGYETAGSIISVSSIASLAGVFVYGSKMKNK